LFNEWIEGMEGTNNGSSFSPFHNQFTHKNLLNFIKDNEVENGFFNKKASGDNIIKALNNVASDDYKNEEKESKFIKIFDKVLEEELTNVIN
jgi:lipid A disaccharide synthetase